MQSDFSLFRERLAHACRARGTPPERLCTSIGLGGRRSVDLAFSGLKALDIYRLAQIAGRLEVSVDWLLGRSDVMELPHTEKGERAQRPVSETPYQLKRRSLECRAKTICGALVRPSSSRSRRECTPAQKVIPGASACNASAAACFGT